jgi:hypothetical protein
MPKIEEVQKFSMMIENLSSELGLSRFDTILHHCEESGLEIEIASTLISSALKSKITEEATESNLIKRGSQLPL